MAKIIDLRGRINRLLPPTHIVPVAGAKTCPDCLCISQARCWQCGGPVCALCDWDVPNDDHCRACYNAAVIDNPRK